MTVLTIILGVLMIFFGIFMMCTPLATFLSAGYFLGIMMFVYGIAGIIRAPRIVETHSMTVAPLSIEATIAGTTKHIAEYISSLA